jgi:excisionase family DNA binding protein
MESFSLVSVPDAARQLNASHEGIRRAAREGRLAAVKVCGRWRIDLSRLADRAHAEAAARRKKTA